MNAKMYAELEEAIQNWLDMACDREEWPDVIIGDRTVEMMAKAATCVFDATHEAQAFIVAQGYGTIGEASGVTK